MHANKDVVSMSLAAYCCIPVSANGKWELAVTNANKSAFCLIKLKPKFFSRYKSLGDTPTERRKGVKCQLLVKVRLSSSCLPVGRFCSRSTGMLARIRRIRTTKLIQQSVLAVLGKPSSIASVERLDLIIVDPDSSLRKRKRREKSRSETTTPRDEDDYEHSEDEAVGGIEAKLIMKLVCKHGELASPFPFSRVKLGLKSSELWIAADV